MVNKHSTSNEIKKKLVRGKREFLSFSHPHFTFSSLPNIFTGVLITFRRVAVMRHTKRWLKVVSIFGNIFRGLDDIIANYLLRMGSKEIITRQ